MTSGTEGPSDNLRVALRRAASLIQQNPAMAEKQAREILKQTPDELNALRLMGTAMRCQGRPHEALTLLEKVVARGPDSALAQEELGLTLRALGRSNEAITALRKAVATQPKLPHAWKALGDLLTAEGDRDGSSEAYRQHLAVTVRHPELRRAGDYLYSGKLAKAEHLCREFLKKHPTDVSAIRMLADVGIRLSKFEDAQKLLERCLELAPDFHLARNNYALVLFRRQKWEQSLAELQKLLDIEPNNPNHLLLKAAVLVRIGQFQQAIDVYEQVLARYPRHPRSQTSYGHALKTVGRQEDAIEAYRAAIRFLPSLGEAYWSLANLKTFRFEKDELAVMREQVASEEIKADDYYHLCFAFAKALEDRQQYDEAFDYYQRGNKSRRKRVHWDADEHHRNCQRLSEFFKNEFFASRAGQGCVKPDPVFIVGLPRSGSTLLEQILASHSQVEGTMELPDIISIARRLSGKKRRKDESRYPQILDELSAGQLVELGEEYLERTRIQRREAPLFIDKMPNNFTHIGLIHLILPNAKIIDARRHPLACCFSGFKQLFARGQNYTYELVEIGRYYRDYVELMDHWDRVLPGRVLTINYEDMVAETEAQVRRLLDYCGLQFEATCLQFYETERAVRTASSEQVRQPVYTDAVGYWRHFRSHLDPLVDALGPVMDRYPPD